MIGLNQAIHLVDPANIGALRMAGARHFIELADWLSLGPCHTDPLWHATLRSAFWQVHGGSADPIDLSATVDQAPKKMEAVDWITVGWSGTLRRWWLMDAWRRARIKRPLWLAPQGLQIGSGVAAALAEAVLADAPRREQYEHLWRAYASDDPRELDKMRRLLDLEDARPHGAFFPVVDGSRIEVSRLDLLALGGLTVREWRPAAELLRQTGRGDRILADWVVHFSDADVVERLLAWTRHPARAPALEMRTLRSGGALVATEFRLTRAGRKLLDEGTRDPGELAPRPVGGAESTRWLRRQLRDGDYELIAR